MDQKHLRELFPDDGLGVKFRYEVLRRLDYALHLKPSFMVQNHRSSELLLLEGLSLDLLEKQRLFQRQVLNQVFKVHQRQGLHLDVVLLLLDFVLLQKFVQVSDEVVLLFLVIGPQLLKSQKGVAHAVRRTEVLESIREPFLNV